MKNIIKLVVKLAVVLRNEQCTAEQENQLVQIQQQIRRLCLTIISFGKVAFSYDCIYLSTLLQQIYHRLLPLVEQILSDKSKQRLDMVFEHLCKVSSILPLFIWLVKCKGFEVKLDKIIKFVEFDNLTVIDKSINKR